MDVLPEPPLQSSSSSSCSSDASGEPIVKTTSVKFKVSYVKLDREQNYLVLSDLSRIVGRACSGDSGRRI